jgi:hypothetical protein
MGVFDYIFDSEYLQRSDIEDLKAQTAQLRARPSRDADMQARILELEQDVGSLALLCKTLMAMLLENHICTGKQLEERMREIDLKDGVEDGMVTKARDRKEILCPECRHVLHGNWKNCLYCGKEITSRNSQEPGREEASDR